MSKGKTGKDAGNVTAAELKGAVGARTSMPPPPPPPGAPAPAPVTLPGTLGQGLAESLASMRRRVNREEKPLPLPWPSLAAQLGGGLWPATFTLLVGSTGSGKSQWAVQLAMNAAKQGTPVLYVALELDRLGMHARALALHLRDLDPATSPKWSELYLGENADGLARAEREAAAVGVLPFHLEVGNASGWEYQRLRPLAEAMRATYGRPFLLVLDFLQLVDGSAYDDKDMRLRMKGAAYAAREVARSVPGATVLLLSATSREHYGTLEGAEEEGKGSNKRKATPLGQGNPSRLVGAAKESGDIEYGADALLVLAREPWPGDGPPPDGTHVWLAVAKVRARARAAGTRGGWVALRFDGSCFGEPPASRDAPGEWQKA